MRILTGNSKVGGKMGQKSRRVSRRPKAPSLWGFFPPPKLRGVLSKLECQSERGAASPCRLVPSWDPVPGAHAVSPLTGLLGEKAEVFLQLVLIEGQWVPVVLCLNFLSLRLLVP